MLLTELPILTRDSLDLAMRVGSIDTAKARTM